MDYGPEKWSGPIPPTAEEIQWLQRATSKECVAICFSNRHVWWPMAALTAGRCDLYDQLAKDQAKQQEEYPTQCGFTYSTPYYAQQVEVRVVSRAQPT